MGQWKEPRLVARDPVLACLSFFFFGFALGLFPIVHPSLTVYNILSCHLLIRSVPFISLAFLFLLSYFLEDAKRAQTS